MKNSNRKESLAHYRQLLYERGALPNRKGKLQIPLDEKKEMQKSGYRPRGIYQKQIKYFVNGLMIGSKVQIEDKIQELKTSAEKFYYKRRVNAMTHESGDFYLRHSRV